MEFLNSYQFPKSIGTFFNFNFIKLIVLFHCEQKIYFRIKEVPYLKQRETCASVYSELNLAHD
jgi:hypothetical protein